MKKILCMLLIAASLLSLSATAEGKLVLYYSHDPEWSDSIIEGFESAYGVDVELVRLGTVECLRRVRAEAERPQADILWGGVLDSYINSTDLLESYDSPEAASLLPGTYDAAEHKWYGFSLMPMVMIRAADAEVSITRWADLLDDALRGRIAVADPVKSSSSFACLMTIMGAYGMTDGSGYDFIAQLIEALDGKLLPGASSVSRHVAAGDYAVGLTYEEAALRRIENGADFEIVYPEEGTHLFCVPVAIVKGCPNPENARLFVDYLLSEDVQSELAAAFMRSTRADVPLADCFIPLEDIPIAPYDAEWVAENTDAFTDFWLENLQ